MSQDQRYVEVSKIRALLAGEGNEPLSETIIARWVGEGMPKSGRGKYDPIACFSWYVARLRSSRRGDLVTPEQMSLNDAQTRLTIAKAENEEMTAKERRRELIPLTVYVSEVSKILIMTKQKLLNLPARLAPKL